MHSIFRSVTDVDFMPSMELHTINIMSYWFLLQCYQYLDYTASNGRMTDEFKRIRMNQDAISAFPWGDQWTPWITHVRIVSVLAKIWTKHLPNTSLVPNTPPHSVYVLITDCGKRWHSSSYHTNDKHFGWLNGLILFYAYSNHSYTHCV